METTARADLTRTFLVLLILVLLMAGSLWTLLPFLGASIWATTVVVATWPLLLRIEGWMGGRRAPATAVMTIVIVAVFVVPFAMAAGVLLDAAMHGVELIRGVTTYGIPPPPTWVDTLPWAGPRLAARWQELAAGGPDAIAAAVRPLARSTAAFALSITGGFGSVALHFLLTVVIAGVLYVTGESAARGTSMLARRIGGERGERTVLLAGQAVRGVALGVVVTALVQSVIAGIGLWLSGVPRPGLLLAVVFVLCVAQLGPLLVLVPAAIWLFWSGRTVWGAVLVAFAVVVAVVDNVLKPVLIRRGVDLPLLLIVAGVIGGIIGFGVLGLFIGPVILAVTYTLLESWVREGEATAEERPLS
jgi:predicted PurR-regulated permease PerM